MQGRGKNAFSFLQQPRRFSAFFPCCSRRVQLASGGWVQHRNKRHAGLPVPQYRWFPQCRYPGEVAEEDVAGDRQGNRGYRGRQGTRGRRGRRGNPAPQDFKKKLCSFQVWLWRILSRVYQRSWPERSSRHQHSVSWKMNELKSS